MTTTMSPERRALARARHLTGLRWHAGTFVVVTGALWLLDLPVARNDIRWVPWVAGAWGLALAVHVLAHLLVDRDVEQRGSRQYLDDSR